jgi:hypothetical protein
MKRPQNRPPPPAPPPKSGRGVKKPVILAAIAAKITGFLREGAEVSQHRVKRAKLEGLFEKRLKKALTPYASPKAGEGNKNWWILEI